MDYEKKYKELVGKIEKAYLFAQTDSTKAVLEEIHSALKESEDERIKKELIGFLRNIPNTNYTCEEMASWLERQGTQPRYNIGDVICDKSCTTLNKEAQPNMEIVDIQNGMYICDKGSIPVSQQDEYELVGKRIDSKINDNSVSNELREASFKHAEKEILNHTFPNNEEFELAYAFEEGAKWDAAQHPNWSDEDDDNIVMTVSRLSDLLSYTREDDSLTKHRKNSIKEESFWKFVIACLRTNNKELAKKLVKQNKK